MKDYYEDENEGSEFPEDMGMERMFDIQDLFSGEEYPANQIAFAALRASIQLLENSFWWRFRSYRSKMKLLQSTYYQITQLLLGEEREEE